jgi:hypothetical protein
VESWRGSLRVSYPYLLRNESTDSPDSFCLVRFITMAQRQVVRAIR